MIYQLTDDDRAAIRLAQDADDRIRYYDARGLAISNALGGSPWRTAYALGALDTYALAREAAAKACEDSDVVGNPGYHPGGDDGSRTLRGAAKNIRALTLAKEVRP